MPLWLLTRFVSSGICQILGGLDTGTRLPLHVTESWGSSSLRLSLCWQQASDAFAQIMHFRTRQELESYQLARLRSLLARLVPGNSFYGGRLQAAGLDGGLESLDEFRQRLPFTTKTEIVEDQRQHPPYGSNLTFPLESYVRLHQTSGTSGEHLRWLDTDEDWCWMVDAWGQVLEGAGVMASDRVMFAFSFGPFIGFWLGFQAAGQMGCLTLTGGGLGSLTRLKTILANEATVLCCTPTYAIRLGETALAEGLDLSHGKITKIIVGGEPGGSLPAVRARIEALWPGSRVFDHYGMTEVGPVTYQTATDSYVHVIETHYLCEIVDPDSGEALEPDSAELGELVLTTLGRAGSPLLRYRTGDFVRLARPLPGDPDPVTTRLAGGILGRRDDMIIVRGVNLFPSAVDQLIADVSGVTEYQVEISTNRGLTELELRVEATSDEVDAESLSLRLERAFRETYNLRVPVTIAAAGELPRFELKAKRWIRL